MTPSQLSTLQSGGLAFFAGGTNIFKAGLVGAILSKGIGDLTHSPEHLSHVGIIEPAAYWPAPDKPSLIESTIWNNISGPQVNDYEDRLQRDYVAKGGHAWVKPFLPDFAPNWDALDKAARQLFEMVKQGKLHYSVERLLGDATEKSWLFAALPFAGILDHLSEGDKGVVCSECAGLLMQEGGVDETCKALGVPWLPKVKPPGQPIYCSPEDLWEMPIFADPVTLL